ncbi:hypothetical protein N2W54_000114 [Lotmaria passim]
MKSFADSERDVFHAIEKLQTSINIVGEKTDVSQSILTQLAEDLCLSEPVSISVLTDQSGSRFYSSTNPLAAHIISLAANSVSNSAICEHVTSQQCRLLVTFPERLANKIAESKTSRFTFNSALFWERLSDTILALYFTHAHFSQICTGILINAQELHNVLITVISLLVRRGSLSTLAQRLFLIPQEWFQNSIFQEQFPFFCTAIFEACKAKRFSLKRHKETEVSQLWHQWNVYLFLLIEKRPELKNDIVKAICKMMNDFSTENSTMVAHALFGSFFVNRFFVLNSSRASIRTAFVDLLSVAAGDSHSSDEELTNREQACFTSLFNLWSDKSFLTTGNLRDNLNLVHPIMYTLLYLKKRYPKRAKFPQKNVGALFDGISYRLDSTRGAELRTCAMTVAAAYATLFVTDPDGAAPLTQDANYSRALESWMKEEPNSNSEAVFSQETKSAADSRSEKDASFPRRAVALHDTYPLNPEEEYTFFITPEQRKYYEVAKRAHHGVILPSSPASLMPSALPAFGQQKYEKDELGEHISIMKSIRECYNAIIGIGRGPNAQLHEVQEAAESGLRGLSDAFSKLKNQIDSQFFRTVSSEIGPLIPVLLPALISLDIHAPDEEKQFLLQLRYDAVVNLIVLNPLQSLSQLSGMLYRSNYGIYQRNELIKAIGEAALLLSRVEVKGDAARSRSKRHMESAGPEPKKVYPPIFTCHLSGEQKTAIGISEGQQTRRWGNANAERIQRRAHLKHYSNLLGDVAAAFVAAFLYKLDADHFAFFQDSDPYTPCAILDSLTIVFQGITNVRHVAPELCERNFDFFFTVCTKHPHMSVKKAAWTSVVEVMRAWCGADPMWIRRKDGQRVLNRDANARRSLMLTQNWLKAVDLLQRTCEDLLQSNDGCAGTALIAVSSLRDLVYDRAAFQSMLSRSEEISLSE